jgi:hypothetical protein
MSLAMTRAEREQFLADLHVGVISIPVEGRAPLTCPIWYAYEPGGEIVIVTGRTSRKGVLLEKAERVSFVAQTEDLPYRYVSVEGSVAIDAADVDRDLRPIAHRYLGAEGGDAYLEATRTERDAGDGSIVVRIRPDRWLTVDYGKQFPAP